MRKATACTRCSAPLDSTNHQCRACNAARAREWRLKNPEKNSAYVASYRAKHPEKAAAYDRKRNLKKNYGLTPDQYASLLTEQDGKCAICGTDQPNGPSKKHFSVDHRHADGKVRGLLCHNCNYLIGYSRERTSVLERAIAYLNTHAIVRQAVQ